LFFWNRIFSFGIIFTCPSIINAILHTNDLLWNINHLTFSSFKSHVLTIETAASSNVKLVCCCYILNVFYISSVDNPLCARIASVTGFRIDFYHKWISLLRVVWRDFKRVMAVL
jgi:hypothetical protein